MTSLGAPAQPWATEEIGFPIVAQPGESVAITVTGPQGPPPRLGIVDGRDNLGQPVEVPLRHDDPGRYVGHFRAPSSGLHRLILERDGLEKTLGELTVQSTERTFVAKETVVTRQGPDGVFDRLTALPAGTTVAIDGSRGNWHRSASTGAWLDGRSGEISGDSPQPSRVSRVTIDEFPNGDARLTLVCTAMPEVEAIHQTASFGGERLSLILANTEQTLLDIKRPVNIAPFMGTVAIRPQARPLATILDIDTGSDGLAGYELLPGEKPGELVVRLRRPVPHSLSDLIIIVDAGHGGPIDSGTVGHRGLPEKVLNLRVAEALSRQLRAKGVTVVMTRTTDADVASSEEGAGNELQARIDRSIAAGAHLFLSVHHNARPSVEEGKTYHGTDVYWYQPLSASLARALAQPVAEAVGEPLATSRYRSFHVIRQTFSPSVLIEFQYLSNPELEKDVLDQDGYAEKAASGVVKGLEAYLSGLSVQP